MSIMSELALRKDENGLIPAIVQDVDTGQILMLAYMNEESLGKTVETGETWFFSRERQSLWHKGETSGNIQKVKEIYVDCDKDALVVKVDQTGEGACHKGAYSCFYRKIETDGGKKPLLTQVSESASKAATISEPADGEFSISDSDAGIDGQNGYADILDELYTVIMDRKHNPKEGSYTCYLWEKGIDKMLKKVGEECAETIIGSKNNNTDEIIYETADLMYHLLVMLAYHGITPKQVFEELRRRR